MKTNINQLTGLELAAYNSYNKILQMCQSPKTNDEMKRLGLKYIRNTITYKCRHLTDRGYLVRFQEKAGRAVHYTYQAIVYNYPIQAYLDFINTKHYNQVQVQHKIIERKLENKRPDGHNERMADIEAKQAEIARMDRLNRKWPKVYAGHWGYQNG